MRIRIVIGSLIALVAVAPSLGETPLSTAFTYQGQLKEGGVPLSDTADFQFTLWDAAGSGNPPVGGTQVGSLQAVNALPVTAGLFTVALNGNGAFGVNAFNGNARWIQIAVRSPAGAGVFTTLAPRQPLTATPYALYALNAPGGSSDRHSLDAVDGSPLDAVYVNNAGKVGIGTTTPNHQLRISGGAPWTSNFWTGSVELDNAAAIGWRSNAAGRRFGIGQTNSGLYFFHTASDPGTTGSPAVYDMFINDTGNVAIGTGATGTSKLDISASGEGAEILRFTTERPWVFRQIRTGPSAGLQLLSTVGQKAFEITAHDGSNVATFWADSTASKVGIGTTNPAAKLHVVGGAPITPSAGGAIQIGNSTGTNVAIDDDEIMARYNGAPTKLYINYDGDDVVFGGAIDIGYEIVTAEGTDVVCPPGKKVLGGGCEVSGGNQDIKRSYPANNGWHCDAGIDHDVGTTFYGLTAYAICARVK